MSTDPSTTAPLAAGASAPAPLEKKVAKKKLEELKKLQEQAEAEAKKKAEEEERKWKAALETLRDFSPKFRHNPWIMIMEPALMHNYLDSLTDVLANLAKHEADLDNVRVILQSVFEGFVDVGRFAKHQPAFYISNPLTIKRVIRLLDQVGHRGSDKALFPTVLSLLGPTFARYDVYDLLADANVAHSLLSFARTDWMPNPATLNLLLKIIEKLSSFPRLLNDFVEDAGYDKLQMLAHGEISGFNKKQQSAAQSALHRFPPWRTAKPRTPNSTDGVGSGDSMAMAPATSTA